MNMSIKDRSVECCVCGSRMYYKGDTRFEPEKEIRVLDSGTGKKEYTTHYVHKACYERVLFPLLGEGY